MQSLAAPDLQDNEEVLERENTSRRIEHECITDGTVSSVDSTRGHFLRTDGNKIGDNENTTIINGSVNTTVEDSLELEQNTDDGSGDTEEWNCTIQ